MCIRDRGSVALTNQVLGPDQVARVVSMVAGVTPACVATVSTDEESTLVELQLGHPVA